MRISDWISDVCSSDLVPDYLTRVEFGAFYGWPWNYWGGYEDKRVEPGRPDLREYTHRPDYGLGAHTAALGLTFAEGATLGEPFTNGAFIGLHGSWNRKPLRSEEHTSELQSLMRNSYAVFCLKKKKHTIPTKTANTQ